VLAGHKNGGIELAFSHSGDLLASYGWDQTLRLWDPRTGKQLLSTPSPWMGWPPAFSPDDRLLAAAISSTKLGLWEVHASQEYRTLVSFHGQGKLGDCNSSVSPHEPRLLAEPTGDGVQFWDLATGRELATLPLGRTFAAKLEPAETLLTNGPSGLFRWPVQKDETRTSVRIGPPQKISAPGRGEDVSVSLDGRVTAVAQFERGALVLHADCPDQPIRLGPQSDVRYVAVSPNGRWVATGSHNGSDVKVWEARSGRLEKELRPGGWSLVAFCPSGKWLATAGGGCRLWEVGSWREGPALGDEGKALAFSSDGRVLAVETGQGAIRLVDPDTGREYGRLEDPNQDRASHLTFSPDGRYLIASSVDSQSLHVWDLAAIRSGLAELGIGWELPLGAADTSEGPPAPLQVTIDPGADLPPG
jgi:WD40 repeat protein